MRISEILMLVFVVAIMIACLFGPYGISIILGMALCGVMAPKRRRSGIA